MMKQKDRLLNDLNNKGECIFKSDQIWLAQYDEVDDFFSDNLSSALRKLVKGNVSK